MRRVLLNVTTSLDGYLADPEGGVDWLQPFDGDIPRDYLDLLETIDTFVMGRATWEVSRKLEGGLDLFAGKRVVVFTSRTDLGPYDGVEFVHEAPPEFVAELKQQAGGTVWLFGGGQLASALIDAGLVDDYLIAVQPIVLGTGIPLWRPIASRHPLTHTLTRQWPGGVVELRYSRLPA